jgi:hypothetical protein
MPWKPGEWRDDPALQGPFDDVPDHLVNLLTGWVERGLSSPEAVGYLALTFRITITDPNTYFVQARVDLMKATYSDPELLLSFTDALLGRSGWANGRGTELEGILAMAGSAYAIRSDWLGLEMRVLPEARDAVAAAIASMPTTSSIGEHLAAAWKAAFSISPDPVKAYSEAIKAVEAAAAPVLTPNDSLATLGKLIGHLAGNLGAWNMVISKGNRPHRSCSRDDADTLGRTNVAAWRDCADDP